MPKEEKKAISRQSTETTESTAQGTYTASLSRPRTAVGRRPSVISTNDPLGLFAPATKEPAPVKDAPKPKKKSTTADWLGLEPDPQQPPKEVAPIEQPQPEVLTLPDHPQSHPAASLIATLPTFDLAANPLILTASNFGSQNILQGLQQQDAQVRLASQMKNQETTLLEMQRRQQELLVQQEAQFNGLLQKQLMRQNQIESTIRAQQDRINANIQLLMSQPSGVMPTLDEGGEFGAKVKESDGQIDVVELKAEVKRLELEKLRLEDLLSNVNANHDKEIEFIESSHRKQIQVLEENFENIETRLKQEIKSLEQHYSEKLERIENEKNLLVDNYQTKLKDTQTETETIVKKLKDNYEAEINALGSEHKTMIENIRQSKLMEFAVIQNNTSYLDTLRNASHHLENVSGDLQTLRDEMYSRIDLAHKDRESKLDAREKQTADKERRLTITEEASQQERVRLMNLVATLETQLNKLSQDTSDEQWTLRQKMSTIEVERTSFEREKQFARDQLLRDEKRCEELKVFQLNETQRLMQQIQDEKQLILIEWSKLEASKKLQTTSNAQSLKTEAEAALKVAQDAAHQADHERERYLNMQRQLEARKRELKEEENAVHQKQDELESVICSAKSKERHVQGVLERSRQAEQNFNAKIQLIQAQVRQLAEREARISQDRFELSRERLELQEVKRRLAMNKCSLCRIGEQSVEISRLLTQDNQQEDLEHATGQPTNISYALGNFSENTLDNLFDVDLIESLKKMQSRDLRRNFSADFDHGLSDQPQQFDNQTHQTHTVPTQTLESDLMLLNLDIHNFGD